VSILHRVSGAGMFICFPVLLWLFSASLSSPESFATFKSVAGMLPVKVVLAGLLWAFVHHFCAGIRFLLLDLHIGIEKEEARKSAVAVLAVSIPLTLILWGVLL
jgi:succinate dehydrogenase / fumarate reductase cytochrome b subunit